MKSVPNEGMRRSFSQELCCVERVCDTIEEVRVFRLKMEDDK